MQRMAAKLYNHGIRAFRMDLRGCGAGALLSRLPYHSGQTGDVIEVLAAIAKHCKGSPITLAGFSLSGNIGLKLASELGGKSCHGLDSVISVCAPIDLAACSRNLANGANRYYDRHFLKELMRHVKKLRHHRSDSPKVDLSKRPRTLFEFDDRYTAPVSGFLDAEDYYTRASSCRALDKIALPTLMLHAGDDPLIPMRIYDDLRLSPTIDLQRIPHGGHLGFISRRGVDPDQRWLDWRIVEWVSEWDRIVRG
jgi:predicted alpha/beta-fold hydrolase